MKKIAAKLPKNRFLSNDSRERRPQVVEAKPTGTTPEQNLPQNRSLPVSVRHSADEVPSSRECAVALHFHDLHAEKVFAAGTFNNWRVDSTPLKRTGNGEWVLPLTLRPGTYEYRFIVDGQWCDDPLATDRVRNPHGGWNAVLKVSPRVIQLTEHLPA